MTVLHDLFYYAVDIINEYGILQQKGETVTMTAESWENPMTIINELNYLLTCIRESVIFVDSHCFLCKST